MVHRLKGILTLVIFISLALIFFESILHKEVFSEKYGISAGSITTIFLLAEVFFNLGIILMLKGSGVFKIGWRDLIRFRFEKLRFSTKTFTIGFIINRLAASIPWIYVLSVGWKKLPITVTGLIILELVVVIIISIGVIEVTEKYAYKKS